MSITIKRALISVSNKEHLLEFAKQLKGSGVEILSTGGTYNYLTQNGVEVTSVKSITNFPEILDGRVKTLHPMIHGAILAQHDNKDHQIQLQSHRITPIDLVCVNLYPFEGVTSQENCTFEDAIENIDIGGVALIRASAKNHQHVLILTNPKDYSVVMEELSTNNTVSKQMRLKLAQQAFSHCAYYDSVISQYLVKQLSNDIIFNEELTVPAKLIQTLRYGENSHQIAAFYKDSGNTNGLLASFKQIQGKELSYNNLADADTAWECVRQFQEPACVIVKHANPCGASLGKNILEAYNQSFSCDPISSFGGIVAFNKELDLKAAIAVTNVFVEVLIAPGYSAEAMEVLAKKTNVRVLQIDLNNNHNRLDYKRIGGGLLVQTPENKKISLVDLEPVTINLPTNSMYADLLFAWSISRFVKSNAIILVKNQQTVGIGAGQMSRIDSTKIAINKAIGFGFNISGAVCASDAFFPFRDNVDLLAESGIKAIIQPGGSIKDKDVFAAADELNLAMVLTKYRAFRH